MFFGNPDEFNSKLQLKISTNFPTTPPAVMMSLPNKFSESHGTSIVQLSMPTEPDEGSDLEEPIDMDTEITDITSTQLDHSMHTAPDEEYIMDESEVSCR